MMRKGNKLWLLAAGFAFVLASCGSGDEPQGQDPDVEPTEGDVTRLRLSIVAHVPTGTRATPPTPSGGEDSDGREDALERENRVYNLNLFFYESDDPDALNSADPSAVKIKKHEYVSSGSDEGFEMKPDDKNDPCITAIFDKEIIVKGYSPSENDWVLVIANAGEIKDVKNLGELRDGKFDKASWSGSPVKKITRFTMATARTHGDVYKEKGKVVLKGSDTSREGNQTVSVYAATASVTVERTAARIDFMYRAGDLPPLDKSEIIYYVKGKDPTYWSKVHITHILPVNLVSTPSYMFKHVTDGFNTGETLVCADETPEKGKPTNYVLEPTTLSLTKTFMNGASEILAGSFDDKCSVLSIMTDNDTIEYSDPVLPPTLSDINRYAILGYANENTVTGIDNFTRDYITGLAFKAVYEPYAVYEDAEAKTLDSDYMLGQTFWQFSATSHKMEEKDNVYFSSLKAAEDYKAAHPEKNGIVTEFTDGVCYYNMWIRHANIEADPHLPFEMEYAIVRNNIYRIAVSFTGVGTPKPEMREPDNIVSRVFVRKWNFRPQPEIAM